LGRAAAPVPGGQARRDLGEGGPADPAAGAEDVYEMVLGVVEDRVVRVAGAGSVRRVGDDLAEGPPLIVRRAGRGFAGHG
jgi:hypothetical protein